MWLSAKIVGLSGQELEERCPHCNRQSLLAEVFLNIRFLSLFAGPPERVYLCKQCGGTSNYPAIWKRLLVASYLLIMSFFIGIPFVGCLWLLSRTLYMAFTEPGEFPRGLVALLIVGALVSGGGLYWIIRRLNKTIRAKELVPYDWRFSISPTDL